MNQDLSTLSIKFYEVEDLVYSDHYYKHIKEYLLDFVVGKVFMSVQSIPNTSIAPEPLFASV